MPNPYIPSKDANFQNWLQNFSDLLTATPTVFGLVAGDAVIVATSYTAWNAAYLLATNPTTRTSVTVAAKDVAKANSLSTVRPYAQRIAVNPAVDNSDKVAIGVNPRGTVPTPIPAPTSAPTLYWRGASPGVIQLAYKDTILGGTKKKPFGAISLELWTDIPATGSPTLAAAKFRGAITKSPFSLVTTGDAGKAIGLWCRFATRSGPAGVSQVGPWSAGLIGTIV